MYTFVLLYSCTVKPLAGSRGTFKSYIIFFRLDDRHTRDFDKNVRVPVYQVKRTSAVKTYITNIACGKIGNVRQSKPLAYIPAGEFGATN